MRLQKTMNTLLLYLPIVPAKNLINKGVTGEISAIVSKAVPKCELPCDVFVYVSAEGEELSISHTTAKYYPAAETGGYGSCTADFYYAYSKNWAEDCDRFYDKREDWFRDIQAVNWNVPPDDYLANGKAVARFVLFDIDPIEFNNKSTGQTDFYCDQSRIERLSGLDFNDIYDRIGKRFRRVGTRNVGYLWHIRDFAVLEKPKELNEFRKTGYMIAYDKLIEETEDTCNLDPAYQPYEPFITVAAEDQLKESVAKLDKEHEVKDQAVSWFDPDDPNWSEVEYIGKA